MPPTCIIECNQCSGLFIAAADQKTRTCPFCGIKVNLQRAKRLAQAENGIIASEMLRKIKSERQLNTTKPPPQIDSKKLNSPFSKPYLRKRKSRF